MKSVSAGSLAEGQPEPKHPSLRRASKPRIQKRRDELATLIAQHRPRLEAAEAALPADAPLAHIYCRVSTAKQADGWSLETQFLGCAARAHAEGCRVAYDEVFADIQSGALCWERDDLQGAEEGITDGRVRTLIAWCVDRAGREPWQVLRFVDTANKCGCRLRFAQPGQQHVAPEHDDQEWVVFIYAKQAKSELKQIVERCQRGRRAWVDSGLLPRGNQVPLYGYRWADGPHPRTGKPTPRMAYVEHPERASWLVQIYQWCAFGREGQAGAPAQPPMSLYAIRQALHDAAVSSPTGNDWWHVSTLLTLLRDPFYVMPCTRRTERARGVSRTSGRFLPLDQLEPLPPHVATPLVTPAVWHAVQAELDRRRDHQRRPTEAEEPPLLAGGYVHCGHCGYVLRVSPGGRVRQDGTRARYYKCRRAGVEPAACRLWGIRCARLDHEVWDRLIEVLGNERLWRENLERVLAEHDPVDAARREATRLAADEAKFRRLLHQTQADLRQEERPAVRASLRDDLDTYHQALEDITRRRVHLDSRVSDLVHERHQIERLLEWSQLGAAARSMAPADRRRALAALHVDVQVYPRWRTDVQARWYLRAYLPVGQDLQEVLLLSND